MGVSDILILLALACVLYLAVRSVIRRKKSGCGCGCEGCPGCAKRDGKTAREHPSDR